MKIGIIGERHNKISLSMLAAACTCCGIEVVWFVDASLLKSSYQKLYGERYRPSGFMNGLYDRLLRLLSRHHQPLPDHDCKNFCDSRGIAYITPRNNSINSGLPEEMYCEPQVDVALMAGCDQLLDENGLKIARYEIINYHYSPLPAYRGKNALAWQWINREPYIGYSFHVVDLGVDTGRIVYQGVVNYDPEESLSLVTEKVVCESSQKLCELFDCLKNGKTVVITSDKPQGSYYSSKKFIDYITADRSKSVVDVLEIYRRFGHVRLKNGLMLHGIYRTENKIAYNYSISRKGITIPLKDGIVIGDIGFDYVRYLLNKKRILHELNS